MTRRDAAVAVGLAAVAVALLVALPVPALAAGGSGSAALVAAPGVASPKTPYIQHLVVIVLENEGRGTVNAYAPYERYLAAHYGDATNMYAACHPSAPNYLAMVAAVVNQCGSDTWTNYTNTTLFQDLGSRGFTWGSYAEDLPGAACTNPGGVTAGLFATRHVPALFFASVTKNVSYCKSHVLVSGAFNSSMAAGSLRNYSFYTPNLCDDGHDGCGTNVTSAQMTRQADAWLRDWLGPILNHTGRYSSAKERAEVNHTAFVVTWDEAFGLNDNAGYNVSGVTNGDNYQWCQQNLALGHAVCGGRIYTVVVSPYSLHRTFVHRDSGYGLDHMVEWLFHLRPLNNPGGFDNSTAFPAMKPLFNFTANS